MTVRRIVGKEIEDTVGKQDYYCRQEVLLPAEVPVVGEEETYHCGVHISQACDEINTGGCGGNTQRTERNIRISQVCSFFDLENHDV